MALPPQKFREAVLQILYSAEVSSLDEEAAALLMTKELKISKKSAKLACERVKSLLEKLAEIDEHISKTSLSYSFERIQRVEKSILRLGVYELLFDAEIPPKVAIAEAIRLARKFSTPEAATFVNALLDAIYRAETGSKANPSTLKQSIEALIESEKLAEKASLSDLNESADHCNTEG